MQKLPTSYRCQDLFLTMYENLLSCRITYTDEECFEAFNKTQNLAKEMYGSDIVDDNLMCDEHITRLAEIQ
ncbi:hypothetical protein GW750_09390 [bacterium]|nr:hypothetical protein [bacterium]